MRPSDPAPRETTQEETQPSPVRPPAPDLSLNKILAAAGAAATSAVLGSLFGVAGTVLGAAVGAVASTVAASLYQRSLDRARTAVASHVTPHVTGRLRGGEGAPDAEATVVMPPPVVADDPRTVFIAPQVPGPSRRRILGYVVATVLGFVLALGGVTAVEAVKGSTLITGQAGTSVGRVLQGGGTRRTATPTPTPTPTSDNSDDDSGDSHNTDNEGDNDHHHNDRDDDSDSDSPSATKTHSSSPSESPSPTTSSSPSRSSGLLGGLGSPGNGSDQ